MSFSFVAPGTKIFRTRLAEVKAQLRGVDSEATVAFAFDFDNFRTYDSGDNKDGTGANPEWSSVLNFNYETRFPQLLAAKRMRLTFRNTKTDEFIGEIGCDLLTLAAGVSDCTLTVLNGDIPVGKCTFVLEMEEVAETTVNLGDVTFQFANGARGIPSLDLMQIRITTKSDPPFSRIGGPPREIDASRMKIIFSDLPAMQYGTTVATMVQECGVDLSVVTPGFCSDTVIGTARVIFGQFELTVIEKSFVPFDGVPVHSESGDVVGSASGTINLKNMPKFVQMYSGRMIDGVIHGGQMFQGEYPMPPLIAGSVTTRNGAPKESV
jgi:hypothetical protein